MVKLFRITEKLGRKRPIARLLKESGRLSISPVFVVGIYSGLDKIGEGYGSSLAMSEERAAKDALANYYMKELEELTDEELVGSEEEITFFDTEKPDGEKAVSN